MATWSVDLPYEFIDQLNRLADKSPEIMEDILNAGMDVLEPRVKRNLELAIADEKGKNKKTGRQYKRRSTGELIKSMERMKAEKYDGVWRQRLHFKGRDNKGVRNNEKAAYIEYGREKHAEQSPRYFIRDAVIDTREKVVEAMQEAFNKHL